MLSLEKKKRAKEKTNSFTFLHAVKEKKAALHNQAAYFLRYNRKILKLNTATGKTLLRPILIRDTNHRDPGVDTKNYTGNKDRVIFFPKYFLY